MRYPCPYCDMSRPTFYGLKQHVRRVHGYLEFIKWKYGKTPQCPYHLGQPLVIHTKAKEEHRGWCVKCRMYFYDLPKPVYKLRVRPSSSPTTANQ